MVNGELIGTFGNLVNRVCVFTEKHFPDGVSNPDCAEEIWKQTEQAFTLVGECIETGKFRQAFRHVLQLAEAGNRYMHEKEPWKTVDTDPAGTQAALFTLLHTIRHLAVLVHPLLPHTSSAIQSFFGDSAAQWRYQEPPKRISVSGTRVLFEKVEV